MSCVRLITPMAGRGSPRLAFFDLSPLGRWLPGFLAAGVAAAFAADLAVPLVVQEPAGLPRARGHVTSGVPFPPGTLATSTVLRLVDEQGAAVPLQTRTTATWRDGSVKWALLDFQADLAAAQTRPFTLRTNAGSTPASAPPVPVRVEERPDALWIETGPLRFSIAKTHLGVFDAAFLDLDHDGRFAPDEQMFRTGLRQSLILAKEFTGWTPRVLPPEEVVIEEPGPLRAVVRVGGWVDDGGTNRLLRYRLRIQAWAGAAQVLVQHTVFQLSPRLKMLWVKDLSLQFQPAMNGPGRFALGGQPEAHTGGLSGLVSLVQLKESRYSVAGLATTNAAGLRAPGWVDVADDRGGVRVAVADFWQQFPKALRVSTNELAVGLYPLEEPELFDMDQGLAKTHELLFSFHPGPVCPVAGAALARVLGQPLFAVAPTRWYCDSQVFGDAAPFDFDLFPDYETLTEASGDKLIKSMATGLRHWGDYYYGGPYKGKNAYMNLEYDMPHNFLVQFGRTGQGKYLEAARRMAQHQADIDVNHFTHWQWKHSPRHTETQAEFGHTFTRGLIEAWFLTGQRGCLEAAIELGDYFASEFQNPRALGNERQIGWGLISLLPVYEATWDPRYLRAVTNTLDRLINGLDTRGRFNIRWDNRIAFFNGIAATGLIYVHRATGDERTAEAALRVIRRTKGFYPEYSGRTLEALAWAFQRTQDPDYLDQLKLTWEATLSRTLGWRTMELGAMTIFTVHALPFLERSGYVHPPADPIRISPGDFASENGRHAHHLPHPEGQVFLRNASGNPFTLILVRKGAWKGPGRAVLTDPEGRVTSTLEFPREAVIFQRRRLEVPAARPGAWRLDLRAPAAPSERGGSFITWDVVTPQPLSAVLMTPAFQGLEYVTPRLYTTPQPEAEQIELELTGEGEGFKRAVLYDPEDQPAATIEAFIDLGDQGRHSYKLSAPIPPRHRDGLWSVSLQDVSLTRLTGLRPYFATSPTAFFRPDQGAGQ